MSDIRMFGSVNGATLIGEYVDTTVGERLLNCTQRAGRYLRNPMRVQMMQIPSQIAGGKPTICPTIIPINTFTDIKDIRDSVEDINLDNSDLLEFKNILQGHMEILTEQYNSVLTGIDLDTGGLL